MNRECKTCHDAPALNSLYCVPCGNVVHAGNIENRPQSIFYVAGPVLGRVVSYLAELEDNSPEQFVQSARDVLRNPKPNKVKAAAYLIAAEMMSWAG